MQWKSLTLVLAGVLVGCAATAATHVLASYPAAAPRFEHMCMGPSATIDGINDDVARAAAEGWELAAMTGGVVCFKRPR